MANFYGNIEDLTKQNDNFRKVLYTGPHCQLVVMSLKPKEEIGAEVHDTVDQFIRIESGEAQAIINSQEYSLSDDDAIIVPAGAEHNVINTSSDQPLKLYTIYSPPEHPDGTIHKTKQEADAAEHH